MRLPSSLSRSPSVFRPHLIVSEMFTAAAGIAAELLDVPFAVAGWPAMQTQSPGSKENAPGRSRKTGSGASGRATCRFWRDRRQLGAGWSGRPAFSLLTSDLLEPSLVCRRPAPAANKNGRRGRSPSPAARIPLDRPTASRSSMDLHYPRYRIYPGH